MNCANCEFIIILVIEVAWFLLLQCDLFLPPWGMSRFRHAHTRTCEYSARIMCKEFAIEGTASKLFPEEVVTDVSLFDLCACLSKQFKYCRCPLSLSLPAHLVQPGQAAPDLWGARAKDWVQPFVVGADCREISAVSHALARSLAHLQPAALMTSIIKRDRGPKSLHTAQCTLW